MPTTPPRARTRTRKSGLSTLQRWGVPAAVIGSALTAAGFYAAWLWTADYRIGDVATSAAWFAATLLCCWIVGRARASSPTTAAHPTETLLAAVVVLAAVGLAAARLDGSPITYDEQEALVTYGSAPLAAIATTYDDTNNHVLHTLLVSAARHFGGWSLVVLRQPAFLSFCLFLPALWWFARQEYGPTAAVFATAFTGMSPLVVEYATHARGHTLLLLFFTAALLCGRSLVRKPDNRALWAAWAGAIALGLFTMPLMVFPAATTLVWMLLVRWREGGRAAAGPFAVKTAAWSAVALAGAGVLYGPIIAAEGIRGLLETLSQATRVRGYRAYDSLLWHPFEIWHAWHFKHPSWANGVLAALVCVGAAVSGRGSRPRVGTLLLAAGAVTGLLLTAKPFEPTPRLVLWMVPPLMLAAGVGAAFALEQAVARVGIRWPRVAAGPGRSAAVWTATVLVAGALALWSAQPGLYMTPPAPAWRLPAMAAATAGRMESGDYFTTISWLANFAVLHLKHFGEIDNDAGFYFPLGTSEGRWSVHRVAPETPTSEPWRRPASAGKADGGRLFVLYPRSPTDTARTFARELVEAHPPDHELVAAFDGGTIYLLNDWIKHPREGQ